MWIRVESFEPSSSPSTPMSVLNFFCGAGADAGAGRNRQDGGGGGGGRVLFSLGRKTGDICFPQDKTVSRQHFAVRCCIHDDDDDDDDKNNKPRNAAERRACAANPFHMCLVLDNFGGKAGTTIVEKRPRRPSSADETAGNDDQTTHMDEDEDDEETDEEGHHGMVSQAPTSVSQGENKMTDISAFGDGTLLPESTPLSACLQQFWKGEKEPPQMIRLEVGQSRVLDLLSTTNHHRSIWVQPGHTGSIVQITWVPFSVVFSRVPKEIHSEWRKNHNSKFHRIGALEETAISENTTHLITPQVLPTSKPLTAYCRGIPIVTPDYLQALLDHIRNKMPKDPLPSVEDFKAPFPEDGSLSILQNQAANPKLMEGYTVFTMEMTEFDPLIRFAGGTIVPLYEQSNEKARLQKVDETLLQQQQQQNNKDDDKKKTKQQQQQQQIFLVLSSTKNKRLISKLAGKDGIFPLQPEAWAKAVRDQNPKLVDAKGNSIPLPSTSSTASGKSSTPPPTKKAAPQGSEEDGSDTEDEAPAHRSQEEERGGGGGDTAHLQTQQELTNDTRTTSNSASARDNERSSRKRRTGDDSINATTSQEADHSMTELQMPSGPTTQKRRRRGEAPRPAIDEEPAPQPKTIREEEQQQQQQQQQQSKNKSNKRNEESSPQEDEENDDDFPVEQDARMEEEQDDHEELSPSPKPTTKGMSSRKSQQAKTASSNSTMQQGLAKPDATGWFTIAPKDNALRKAWRKKASKMNAEENDGQHLMPPAQSEQVIAIIQPTTGGGTNPDGVIGRRPARRNKTGGPNFKTFRKNIVPRTVDAGERIALQAFQAKESEQQQRLEENERELEQEQRRADELFRDIGAGASTTRRRRR